MDIYKVDGKQNPADMFTKALPTDGLTRYCQQIGMTNALPSDSS
ncbi:hypothetical protein PC129_g22767 [Phytophthora cactorum]|uniref:Uncharacterized protein n=1 Tax=Phytophthora cactorum TaxID=29920 RepID=A0A329R841_9STRA|nr:hypothetical protein Pcac1_g1201 [Phytophthora cactorum]KAG2794099.1 hypothetical protein PC112_g23174 [Phytophthora cactorum]KAG2797998.1 hypothetical protein PC111_g21043 [Phytophthora cactorum]KAG2828474.1 hypothetical protein PC113_g21464 [Phytophthora cactorum]KAG2877130.1 hypothetical protein PC114_g23823 [Phytophthora cactorum]